MEACSIPAKHEALALRVGKRHWPILEKFALPEFLARGWVECAQALGDVVLLGYNEAMSDWGR